MRIEHVQVAMPPAGEERARAFYVDFLGLREVAKPGDLKGRGGCWFVGDGGLKIHLGVDPTFRPASKAHVALVVDCLAKILEKAVLLNIAVEDDLPLPGFDRAFVRDPFGNRFELLQLIAD